METNDGAGGGRYRYIRIYMRINRDEWYDGIKREPWKVAVLDRLQRVEEDVSRAISAAGLSLDDQELSISGPPGQERSGLVDEAEAVVRATFWYIEQAVQSLTPSRRWWRRRWDRLWRESLAPAYINLHAAETSRVLLLSADQLMAVLPSIRQRVAAYLPIGDPRRAALDLVPDPTAVKYRLLTRLPSDTVTEAQAENAAQTGDPDAAGKGKTAAPVPAGPGPAVPAGPADQAAGSTIFTGILGLHQQIATEAMGEACKAEDLQQAQVRRFRWVLVGAFVALLVLVVFMGVVASIEPKYLPLCLPAQDLPGSKICPIGGSTPNSADLPLILGMGTIGAALAVATSLATQKVDAGVRYSLSVAQGLVKVAFGALTAVLGIIILGSLTSREIPGILGTQSGLLTVAVIFGYSQQIFTRLIDRQASSLLNAASPATPATGQGPASTPLTGTR
jgi:hypothetical protein